jgi:streptogramin lyase
MLAVYVADKSNRNIRRVTPAGMVTTLAGSASYPAGSSDGTGSAARFNSPAGVAVDSSGNVYVADSGNNTIRKVTPTGVVTTLAGLAGSRGSNDGTGSAARFNGPWGVTVDGSRNVYVADTYNNTIRKVTPAGMVPRPSCPRPFSLCAAQCAASSPRAKAQACSQTGSGGHTCGKKSAVRWRGKRQQ